MMRTAGPVLMTLPACPLMCGTGFITAIGTLASGGGLVTLDNPSLDAVELWDAVERNKVQSIAIVGDAFAKPMLKVLDENPGRFDMSSLITIVSSGVMWSKEVKQGLIGHIPQVRSEEHTSELQSLMRISYAVFCLKKKKIKPEHTKTE